MSVASKWYCPPSAYSPILAQYHEPFTIQIYLVSTLFLATLVRSTPLHPSKSCKQYQIPLNVTSLNLNWALRLSRVMKTWPLSTLTDHDAILVPFFIHSRFLPPLKQLFIPYPEHYVSQLAAGMGLSCWRHLVQVTVESTCALYPLITRNWQTGKLLEPWDSTWEVQPRELCYRGRVFHFRLRQTRPRPVWNVCLLPQPNSSPLIDHSYTGYLAM